MSGAGFRCTIHLAGATETASNFVQKQQQRVGVQGSLCYLHDCRQHKQLARLPVHALIGHKPATCQHAVQHVSAIT